jgi:hypothetical protein
VKARSGRGGAGNLGGVIRTSVLAGAVALLAPAAAGAQTGGTAPSYPGNTLKLEATGPWVAGTPVKVKMSGHAEWGEPTSTTTTAYSLSLYVQDPTVDPACSPSYGQQLQKSINLPLNASTAISGFVVQDGLNITPTPPNAGEDWSGDSTPFAVKLGVENVLLCGYQRYITDDVAWFQLPMKVEQPTCKARSASVRKGTPLRLACNVSGTVTVRFSGRRSKTIAGKLSTKDGSGKISTRSLAKGRYRVTVKTGALALGKTFTLRVR